MVLSKLKIKKGTLVYLSESGARDWWYPDRSNYICIEKDCDIEYLSTWIHDQNFYPFKISSNELKDSIDNVNSKYVCIWLKKSTIENIENDKFCQSCECDPCDCSWGHK